MSAEKDRVRALRYRRLALAETDRAKAELLNHIADEAERGTLCTADRVKTLTPTPRSAMPDLRGLVGW
jgi:hypothetical protein